MSESKDKRLAALGRIQKRLEELYSLDLEADVGDFFCDAEVTKEAIGEAGVARKEALMVHEDEEGISVGLYVDEGALEVLHDRGEDGWFGDETGFAACCLATEGVSHFVYLLHGANDNAPVSQLELELQAEVDKYATSLLAGNGVGLIRERSRFLRQRLFDETEFLDDADTEEGERYRTAQQLARRYAQQLETKYVDRGEIGALVRELKRFYRTRGQAKLNAVRGR